MGVGFMNRARNLEYPFALAAFDMQKTDVERESPAAHALDKSDLIDPPEGIKPVDPRDKLRDTLDEPDDIGVHVS
jgi:hypothetical protein